MRSQDQDSAKERKTTSPSKTQRLHKLLAQSGIGSRREMEKYIEAGRVHVNDSPATLGQLIHEHDVIKIDGKTIHLFFDLKFLQTLQLHLDTFVNGCYVCYILLYHQMGEYH